MARRNKLDIVSECIDIIRGLKTQMANVPDFMLAGKKYMRQELIDLFQRVIDAQKATASAHGAWAQAVVDERATQAAVLPVRNLYKTHVETTYGKNRGRLENLGFKEKNPKPASAETKAQAVEKRRVVHEAKKQALAEAGVKKTRKRK
jgi:hypothetical protein